jgi:HEAT repeat protein
VTLAAVFLAAALGARAADGPSAFTRLHDDADDVRAAACAELARPPARGPRAYAALLDSFDDPSDLVRLSAAKAAATYEDGGVIPRIEQLFKNEPGANFRRELAVAFSTEPAHLHDPDATRVLTVVLAEDPSANVRRAVAVSLGLRHDVTALGATRQAALKDSDRLVRRAAQDTADILGRPIPRPKPKPVESPKEDGVKGKDSCPRPWSWCECKGIVSTKPVCLTRPECRDRYHSFADNPAFGCLWDGRDLYPRPD